MKSFLKVNDFTQEEFLFVLNRADKLEKLWSINKMPQSLVNKKIALWVFGNGFRNRIAFELGVKAMGGDVCYIPGTLGKEEPLEDVAYYLDNWFSMSIIRCACYNDLIKFGSMSVNPVINARTEVNHPCEIVGDLQYIRKVRGSLKDLNVVFVGEVTNLCMSWFEVAQILPIHVTQIAPPEYVIQKSLLDNLNKSAIGSITAISNIDSQILSSVVTKETDVLYTDCWPKSLSQEKSLEIFSPYRITKEIVDKMNKNGFFMPCPPVTRGQEISIDSLSCSQFCNYEAKKYLLHAQNAIIEQCLYGL